MCLRKASTFFSVRRSGRKIDVSLEFVSVFNKLHKLIILQVTQTGLLQISELCRKHYAFCIEPFTVRHILHF